MTTLTKTFTKPARKKSGRTAWAEPRPEDQVPHENPYTRSALPLALGWFIIPAVLLVLSTALFGKF